jgi:hypothetical protein
MRDLDILQPYQARQWFKWFRSTGQHEEEPGEPVPQEQPRHFERMVQHALAEELITERRAEELLGHAPDQTAEPVFA